ncbi:PQQ-dependent sugar dehydrogenase [Microbulbifer spongiae]|uniref:PQQ-dependent sugar dehydrogenase n=1 Tax=Microbulbifer spongiae TaxID=2944933 RepID=A0ABY9EFP4_9GAMM|nr:PQQ-dependent sugar dehydrogenase [Microbulbifer sp. MI-G]WKD50404.1 PQQ-dependent sugar dehydrogenase [Microbulbifer sp. MI-G]
MLKYTLIFLLILSAIVSTTLAAVDTGISVPWRQIIGVARTTQQEVTANLSTAQGYSLQLFASEVPNARWLAVTRSGDVLVSQPRSGQVSLLFADRNRDGRADGQRVLIEDLRRPHGLLLHEGWLYIAESDAVGRVPFDHSDARLAGSYQRIVEGLEDDGHWTKTIDMGPDGWLYLSSGSSCNVCIEKDPRRATIMRLRPDGSDLEIFATGLRNSVGFDWSPRDGGLYATDNGRDWLGDNLPPDELNRIRQGAFYGWPYAYGDRVPDPDFGVDATPAIQEKIATSVPPVHTFAAHNAPLGLQFLRSAKQPADYRNAALVALHGSWNRSVKDGYKVVSLHWHQSGEIEQRDFLWGFLSKDRKTVFGRPVAIAEDTNGNIYISDDYAGAVYRLSGSGVPGAGTAPTEEAPSKAQDTPPAVDAAAVRKGAGLYQSNGCGLCHQQQLPLTNLRSKYTVQTLAEYFDAPTPPMPNYNFDSAQKKALAHYLMSREVSPQAPTQPVPTPGIAPH